MTSLTFGCVFIICWIGLTSFGYRRFSEQQSARRSSQGKCYDRLNNADRTGFQNERKSQNSVCPNQIRNFVRMSDFFDAFVNSVSCTDAENKNRGNKRPEKPFFSVTEQMLFRCRTFLETPSEQQRHLICRVCQRVKSFCHHLRRADKYSAKQTSAP